MLGKGFGRFWNPHEWPSRDDNMPHQRPQKLDRWRHSLPSGTFRLREHPIVFLEKTLPTPHQSARTRLIKIGRQLTLRISRRMSYASLTGSHPGPRLFSPPGLPLIESSGAYSSRSSCLVLSLSDSRNCNVLDRPRLIGRSCEGCPQSAATPKRFY